MGFGVIGCLGGLGFRVLVLVFPSSVSPEHWPLGLDLCQRTS